MNTKKKGELLELICMYNVMQHFLLFGGE